MPLYKIETTSMVRRAYVLYAETPDAAEDLIDENGDRYLISEEEITEDIDDISLYVHKHTGQQAKPDTP